MTTTTYTFGTPTSYTYDSDKIDISSNTCKLAFEEVIEDYTQTFTSDVGFTYDNTKSEFTGGLVRQKDQRPSDAIFYHNFSQNDAAWNKGGSTTTTLTTATISGGKLTIPTGGNVAYARLPQGAVRIDQTGTLRFPITPNYSVASANFYMFSLYNGTNNNDRLDMYIGADRRPRIQGYDSTGTLKISGDFPGTLSAFTPGVEYIFEWRWDFTGGTHTLLVNGSTIGTISYTYTRSDASNYLYIGARGGAPNTVDSITYNYFSVYNDASPSSYTMPDTAYAETTVTLPPFEHTGDGIIISANSFTVDETDTPKYSVDVRPGTNTFGWWNPSSGTWENSDGSYAQSSTEAEFNTHMVEDPVVYGATYACFRIHFGASNIQASVTTLTINVTEQIYSQTDPKIYFNSPINCTDISAISTSATVPSGSALKLTMKRNGTEYYYTGSAWAASSGYAQSNTFAELTESVLDALTGGTRKNINPVLYLHSDDGKTTPVITNYSLTYDYALPDPTLPNLVDLEGYIYDCSGPVANLAILIRPYQYGFNDVGVFIEYKYKNLGTTDSDGYFHGSVFLQPTNKYWEIKIGCQSYYTQLANQSDVDLSTLTLNPVVI